MDNHKVMAHTAKKRLWTEENNQRDLTQPFYSTVIILDMLF